MVHELSVEADDPEGDGDGDSQELIDDEVAELLAELARLSFDDEDPGDLTDDEFAGDDFDDDDEFDEDGDASLARIRLSRDQVAAFIVRAGELMEAGRSLCPFCGLPLDPAGHICPREN